MAAEKKPRAAKATKSTAATTKKTAATTKPKVVRARKPKVAAIAGITPDRIAERAYYIWVDGGAGDANAHWLQAERELATA